MSLISRGYRVLTEEGSVSLMYKGSKYVFRNINQKFENLKYTIKDEYVLSIDNIDALFSAPSATLVQRNKGRFSSEKEIISDILQESNNDDVFFDIGSNTGIYTLFVAKKCSNVLSFEPYPPNYEMLRKDISRNDLSNVNVYEIALSDSNGTILFDQPAENDVGYGSSSIVDEGTGSSVEVSTRTGDELISNNNLPVPNIIKIDVEGSETLVIDGLESSLSDPACRLVYCEVHTEEVDHRPSIHDFDMDLNDIKSQLQECGFTVEESKSRGSELFLKAYK